MNKNIVAMIYILSLLLCSIFLVACTPDKKSDTAKTSLIVELELHESRIVKLNGMEIHVDLLQDQLESLSRKHQIDIELKVSSEVPFGMVHDVQRIMNSVGVKVRT